MGPRTSGVGLITIALCGALAGCGDAREPEPTAAAVSSVAVDPSLVPISLTSDGVVALDGRGVVRINGHRRRRLLMRGDVLAGAASERRLAVILGRVPGGGFTSEFVRADDADRVAGGLGSGRTRVFAGAIGGRLHAVADCPASKRAVIGPAVAGTTVAWRGCGGHTVVVDEDGRRSVLAAGGTPVALAAAGRLVAWIASRGPHQRAVVTLADLSTERTVPVGNVPAVSPTLPAGLALTADGRSRAVLARSDDQANVYCEAHSANRGGAVENRGRVPCAPAALTSAGTLALRAGPTGSVELTLGEDDGTRDVTVARAHDARRMRFVAADRRIAYTRATCTQQTLTVASSDHLPPPAVLPRCPLLITSRRVRASSSGQVRVRVACSRGCRLDPAAGALSLGRAGVTLNHGAGVVRGPSGHVELAFTLSARARRALKVRHQVRAILALTGLDGTHASAVLTLR